MPTYKTINLKPKYLRIRSIGPFLLKDAAFGHQFQPLDLQPLMTYRFVWLHLVLTQP